MAFPVSNSLWFAHSNSEKKTFGENFDGVAGTFSVSYRLQEPSNFHGQRETSKSEAPAITRQARTNIIQQNQSCLKLRRSGLVKLENKLVHQIMLFQLHRRRLVTNESTRHTTSGFRS
ncbi:hypothetical protein OS493_028652 [Desmophyllum pertusum]|uniref:Uncharacterized protein n=1 Tax=Desmophyllum pertusum TaxID=174260 RepID=A0A9X0CIW4_9CNID|nr:hypothetical protein OS493_028652 [Desmophyllum pertusum]